MIRRAKLIRLWPILYPWSEDWWHPDPYANIWEKNLFACF